MWLINIEKKDERLYRKDLSGKDMGFALPDGRLVTRVKIFGIPIYSKIENIDYNTVKKDIQKKQIGFNKK